MPDQPAPNAWMMPPGGPPPTAGRPVYWGGHDGPLFRIHLVNILLGIVTLGIYRFWGIVRIRSYIWSHTAFLGDRLEYTGTGGELLRGFLIVLAFLVPFILGGMGLDLLGLTSGWALAGITALKLSVFLYLLATGRHAARRYFASRSVWRGLRFVVTGSPWHCGAVQFGWWLATIATLGMARPWALAAEARWSLGRLHLGTLPFRFTGRGGQILGPWLVAMVIGTIGILLATLILVALWDGGLFGRLVAAGGQKPLMTPEQFEMARNALAFGIGILVVPLVAGPFLVFAWFSYAAAVMRWRWDHLELGGAHFAMPELGAGRLARLQMGNAFLTLFTFGLLYPLAVARTMRFTASLLWTDRFPDVAAAQQAVLGRHNAEGLANVLDGGGAGLGI